MNAFITAGSVRHERHDGHRNAGRLPMSPGPVLIRLTETIRQVLEALRTLIPANCDEKALAEGCDQWRDQWRSQWQQLQGALRFCGAESLDAFAGLLGDLPEQETENFLSPGMLRAMDSACAALIAWLPELQQAKTIPAGWLIPWWRELTAQRPGAAPSIAALISLKPFSGSGLILIPASAQDAETFLLQHFASGSARACTADEIDKMLLVLLRAEAGSEALRSSLQHLAAAIAQLQKIVSARVQRLHWAVIRVYCELLAEGAPFDLTLAKKILSATGRVCRRVTHSADVPGAVLPEMLLREVLIQIGLFAPVTPASQAVRDCFSLEWQLSPHDGFDRDQLSREIDSLVSSLDELEARWPGIDSAERQRLLEKLMMTLRASPSCASLETPLSALITGADSGQELALAAGLQIMRSALDAKTSDVPVLHRLSLATQALEKIVSRATGDCASTQQQYAFLYSVAPGFQWRADHAALKEAVMSVIADAERCLEPRFEANDLMAAVSEMRRTLDLVSGALSVAGAKEAVALAEPLIRQLDAAMQASDIGNAECLLIASQWVQLCSRIEVWGMCEEPADDQSSVETNIHQSVSDAVTHDQHPIGHGDSILHETSAHTASVVCADSQLGQIFIQEATQRLTCLRQWVSVWAASPGESMSPAAAHEAHALAGSSATVGYIRLHDGSLALEQVIERLARQSVAHQHLYAEAVLRGVQALERELQRMLRTDIASDQTLPDNCLQDLLALPDQLSAFDAERPFKATALCETESDITEACEADTEAEISAEMITANAISAVTGCPASLVISAAEPEADAELRAVFSEEAAELMPQLARLLDNWRAAPRDRDLPSQLLRVLHTLKGSARMAGEMMLGERLHRMEYDVAQLARQGAPNDVSLRDLHNQLAQLIEGAGWEEAETSAESRSEQGAASSAISNTSPDRSSNVSSSSPAADRQTADSLSTAPKLRADLLERAASSAAELLVGSVRAAEDLQHQRQTVAELGENLSRLRAQLRELELQSESRIAAQVVTSDSAFDPLEFDRYTRLQELTRMTSESQADLTSLQRSLARQTDSAAAALAQQTRQARQLQSDLRRASLQAFSSIEVRMRHLAKQTAAETDRDVRLEMDGAQVEIDRLQLDRLNGALQHLIRNAIVHGIETPAQREQAGKPRQGVVRLSLSQQGSELRLQISDDGRGLDFKRIRERAAELGVLGKVTADDESQLAELIFEPGLSTADEVTRVAGRGIGMDAVKAAVMTMGGALKVDSLPGAGTCITLALPQLLSTQQVLVVADGGHQIAVPAAMVKQLMQLNGPALQQAMQTGSFEWQRQSMPLHRLAALFGSELSHTSADITHRASVIVLRQLDQWLAVSVSEVLGHREVVVKQPGLQLAGVPGLAGATLQPDGSVLLIMNLLQLFDRHGLHRPLLPMSSTVDPISDKLPLVMVVDDSLTVRRVSQRLLEKHGYTVVVARHGLEALELLREIRPDAALLDIEMPRMDGFELLSRLRAHARLKDLPVAMVTSRAAERHRQHALQLGANAYFGKPYREQEVLDWLAQVAQFNKNEAPLAATDEAAVA